MKRWVGFFVCVAAVALFAALSGQTVSAQNGPPRDGINGPGGPGSPEGRGGSQDRGGPGGFDPGQMKAMMLQRIQQDLEVSQQEWETISPLVETVMDLQQKLRPGGGMRGPGGPGGPGGLGGGAGRPGRPDGPGPDSPEASALAQTLNASDATDAQISAAVSALRGARTRQQQELQQARQALRGALNVRQEARLVLMGLLD